MECKSSEKVDVRYSESVLISTYWNVNAIIVGTAAATALVLISTYWNVNPALILGLQVIPTVLISTYWNVII